MYIGKTAFQMMLIYNIGFIGLLRAPLMMFGDPLLHLSSDMFNPRIIKTLTMQMKSVGSVSFLVWRLKDHRSNKSNLCQDVRIFIEHYIGIYSNNGIDQMV